jgi:hypothetical protein
MFPFIERIFADGGYAGRRSHLPWWRNGLWSLQIASGFEALPRKFGFMKGVCNKSPEHDADHCEANERSSGCGLALEAADQAAIATDPSERPFENPLFGAAARTAADSVLRPLGETDYFFLHSYPAQFSNDLDLLVGCSVRCRGIKKLLGKRHFHDRPRVFVFDGLTTAAFLAPTRQRKAPTKFQRCLI